MMAVLMVGPLVFWSVGLLVVVMVDLKVGQKDTLSVESTAAGMAAQMVVLKVGQ